MIVIGIAFWKIVIIFLNKKRIAKNIEFIIILREKRDRSRDQQRDGNKLSSWCRHPWGSSERG